MFKKLQLRKEGQGLVEYALILVLVAIVVIAVLLILGPTISGVFCRVTNGLGGSCVTETDEYANYWGSVVYEPHSTNASVQNFCNATAPGTAYKAYDAGSGWRQAGGSATQATDKTKGDGTYYTLITTGTCP